MAVLLVAGVHRIAFIPLDIMAWFPLPERSMLRQEMPKHTGHPRSKLRASSCFQMPLYPMALEKEYSSMALKARSEFPPIPNPTALTTAARFAAGIKQRLTPVRNWLRHGSCHLRHPVASSSSPRSPPPSSP